MARRDLDDHDDNASSTPWHYHTPAVVGASIAGLAVIAIVVAGAMFLGRQFNEPQQAPLNFVEPSFTATASHSSTPTTTATITSTSPPVTTDINPSSTSSSSPSSSDSPDSSTSASPGTAWTRPYTPPSGSESPSTTRRGPRTNVTRTLYPQP